MTPEQTEIMNLKVLLSKCLGAFEIIQIDPGDFNKEGLAKMITELNEVLK